MKYIHPKELLKTSEYVKEPVDILCEKLNKFYSNVIILHSGRGTGKSVTLYQLEKKYIGNDTQFIYTSFDSAGLLLNIPNTLFDERFLNHYYELIFSEKILHYIRNHYNEIYEKYFKIFEATLEKIQKDTDNYIHNIYWKKTTLNSYLVPTELSGQILQKFRHHLKIHSLSLIIDRFDWTNGSNSLVQYIISKFFSLFDKTIITTDDINLQNIKFQKSLLNKGYTFFPIEYGKDENTLKKIIQKRIRQYNTIIPLGYKMFPENIINDEICKILINKTKGNISLTLNSVREMTNIWQWNGGNMDFQEQLENIIEEQIDADKTLKKMIKPPRLYL